MDTLCHAALVCCIMSALAGLVRTFWPQNGFKPVINAVLTLYIITSVLHAVSGLNWQNFDAQLPNFASQSAPGKDYTAYGAELAMQTDADAMGIGEMGIGNTTTSSAVLAVLLGVGVETVTGRGGGITDESFRKKKQVIADAIALNKPDPADPVDVLRKVGGFDLAAMCGAFLGGAASHRPMVIDGFISVVAALCAVRLCPTVRDYLVPSHASYEIGYRLAMEAMGLQPIFLLGMRLGEGSGCPLAFQVLDAACAVINDMATFDQAGIDDGYLDEIREGDKFTVEAPK